MNIPHISIKEDPDWGACVEVEDTELYDFIEDHLTEKCDMDCSGVIQSERSGLLTYTIFFPAHITTQKLQQELEKIDSDEIERIFKINNL